MGKLMLRRLRLLPLAALVALGVCGGAPARAGIVALNVDITIDRVEPGQPGLAVGQHHVARIFYDNAQVDPASRRVVLLHLQHTPALLPKHLDPAQMPMGNAWLDLAAVPLRFHYAAAPTVGYPDPYFVLFDERSRRMTIRRQADGVLLLAGQYVIDPRPVTGPQVDAVVGSSEPVVLPWGSVAEAAAPQR